MFEFEKEVYQRMFKEYGEDPINACRKKVGQIIDPPYSKSVIVRSWSWSKVLSILSTITKSNSSYFENSVI